jgi:hypothetical protein
VDLEPPARVVDRSILVLVVLAALTGVATGFAGRPGDRWVYALHAVGGLVLTATVAWKLRRVAGRLRSLDGRRAVSLALSLATLGTLATGVGWTVGLSVPGPAPLLMVHVYLAVATVLLTVAHLPGRLRLPTPEFDDRRVALSGLALAAAGTAVWWLQRRVAAVAGVDRRFTGSRERGSFAGNNFPVTAWVADDPDPVDLDDYRLRVAGAVDRPLAVAYDDLAGVDDSERATLDCTSGWYADHEWAGVRVGRLLDRADLRESARYVSFRSVTGYRWALPVEEAREALLATRVDGETLSHGHGRPLRLVAPGRRGFQWVKWVETVEVREEPDPGQLAAIFLSGFD